jgi:hypothetical protein
MAKVFASLASEYGLVTEARDEAGRARSGTGLARPALPCLNGHKGNSQASVSEPSLMASAAKTVFCLAQEVQNLASDYPLDRIGFLTLTFKDNCVERVEAWRRFRSLRSRVLAARFVCCIAVSERQKRGAWHFHLIVVTKARLGDAEDARLADMSQLNWREGDRRHSIEIRGRISESLRSEWRFWREIAPRYRFGRCEILPVKSTAEAVGKYVGKYVRGHLLNRIPADKGVRRVSYINFKDRRRFRPSFAWNSAGARRWRQAVAQFALENRCKDTRQLREKFGRRWCYKFRGLLLGLAERKVCQ